MTDEVPKVILELGIDSKGVFSEIDKVKAKYGEIAAGVRENNEELKKLLDQEKKLLEARKISNNPTIQSQFNAKIKETQTAIAKVNEELAKQKTQLKDAGKEAKGLGEDLGNAFDATGAISLQTQLRNLKRELAEATNPEDIARLAQETGHLQEKISDASHQANIFAGSKFQAVSNAIGDIGHKILTLDFAGAAKSSKLLLIATQKINFGDAVKGLKDIGTTLINVGKSLVTNPLFIMATVLGAIAFAAKEMFDTFKAGDAIFEKSVLTLKEMTKATEELNRATRDLALENEIASGKINKVNGEKLKNQNRFKDEYLKLIQETRAKEEQINKEFDEAKNTITLKALRLVSPVSAFATEIKLGQTRAASLLNIEEGFNKEKEALLKKFGVTNSKILIDKANEDAKKAQDLEKERLERLKKLRDLEASNIGDQFARLRAQLTIRYNDEFKAAKGNKDLIKELRAQLDRDINAVNEAEVKANQAKLDKISKAVADANQENLEDFFKTERERFDGLKNSLDEEQRHQTELLTIKLQGNKNSSQLLLINEIANAEAQLLILKDSGIATEDEITKQNNRIIELKAKLNGELDKLDEKRLNEVLDQTKELADAVISATNKVLEAYIQGLDKQTTAQQKRVDDAAKIAENGNSQLLELEKKRLDDLNKERESFVRTQQALAAVELVAETAVMIAKAGSEGGAGAAVTIAAALIALIAGLASARSIAGQAAFYEGGYTGDGNPREESTALGRKNYKYHKEEFIHNHQTTRKFLKHFRDIHDGKMDLNEVVHQANMYKLLAAAGIDTSRDISVRGANNHGDLQNLESLMKENIEAIKNQPGTSIRFDENGIAIIATKYLKQQSRINNLAR